MAEMAHIRPSRGGGGGLHKIPRNFTHGPGTPIARSSSPVAEHTPRPQVDREHSRQGTQASIPLDFPPPLRGVLESKMPSQEPNSALTRAVEEMRAKEAIEIVPHQDMV